MIAQGSDGGGSIRIPAAFCGLFGHKPSRGLHAPLLGKTDVGGLAVAGCLARDVLSPTCGANAPRIGAWKHMSGEEAFHAAVPLGAFTAVYNIGGQAAASVPFGLDDEGMPVGFQLACRQGEDGLLLSLCRQVEQALNERR